MATPAIQQKIETYKGEKAMRHGIAHMARQGWRVTSQSVYQPAHGCLFTLLFGWNLALLLRKRARCTVTYAR